MSRPRLVIGFAEALPAPEVAWSLRDAGFHLVAFARAGSRATLRKMKDVEIVEVTPPEEDLAASISDLRALLEGSDAPLMPLDDAGIWVCDRARTTGRRVVGPVGEQARFALDKRLQAAAASSAGLRVPETTVVEGRGQLHNLSFPLMLKPARVLRERDGRLTRERNFICADTDELEAVLATWSPEDALLAQPLLDGVGYGVFGIRGVHGVEAASAHERIRMMNPAGSGSSACRSANLDPEVLPGIERMLDAIDWRGLFMIELLRDREGTLWFMELNGRAWGSMALARRAGLEYPAWAAALEDDADFRVPLTPVMAELTCRHFGREIVHVLTVLRGPRSKALRTWPSLPTTLHDVLRFRRADRWYNLRPGERFLFLYDTWATVVGETIGKRRR